jgi:hypothetical protein
VAGAAIAAVAGGAVPQQGSACRNVVSATPRDDVLNGTREATVLPGFRGRTSSTASKAHRLPHGGPGNDLVSGGAGDDLVAGAAGDDELQAEPTPIASMVAPRMTSSLRVEVRSRVADPEDGCCAIEQASRSR